MVWIKRLILSLPFLIAALLTILIAGADRFHLPLQHIAGYGFMFGVPWAWLIDRGWLPTFHNYWLRAAIGYLFILWIPATLYSISIWLLFFAIAKLRTRSR